MIIYKPAGRAGEYCKHAANLYRGCGHKCIYCYAPSATRTNRQKFNNEVQPRNDIINRLKKDAEKTTDTKSVLLSFTSDPYQQLDEELQITRQAIKILKENGQRIVTLTKGGKRAERDFDLLDSKDYVGATLTFINKHDSLEWEPGAALPDERITMLKRAKEKDIGTWVSLEPVIDPEQSLELIRQTHEFVDLYKVGKLNYHPRARQINWKQFTQEVVVLLKSLNKQYYIKKDLQKFL